MLSIGVAICLALAGCADGANRPATVHFASMNIQPATANRTVVCHGFGCARRTVVTVSAPRIGELRRIFAAADRSPQAERKAIEKAVMWFDRTYGPVVGTDKDVGGFDPENAGKIGQQDCIDESTSTAGFLVLLEKNGMLKHYKVGKPVARGFFLDGRYPHATATIIDTSSGQKWAVDPWPYDAGKRPDVIPLDRWFQIMRGGARKDDA